MTTANRHGSEKIPYTQRKYKGNSGMEKSMPLRFLNVECGGGGETVIQGPSSDTPFI